MIFVLSLWAMLVIANGAEYEVPRYTVDLDLPPEHRYDLIIGIEVSRNIEAAIESFFPKGDAKARLALAALSTALEGAAPEVLGAELAREAAGIARLTGQPLGTIVLLSSFYDLTASNLLQARACTAIVAQNAHGEVYHGRNLDYYHPQYLAPLVAVLDYEHNGTTRYTAVTVLGMVGFNTAMRPFGFTVSQNERDKKSILFNFGFELIIHRLSLFSLIRETVSLETDMKGAVKRLASAKLSAAAYFVVGGRDGEGGQIIANDRDGQSTDANKSVQINDTDWYVVETNYDLDLAPESDDNRRNVAHRLMSQFKEADFDADALWRVLSSKEADTDQGERPLNNDETMYTCSMSSSRPDDFKCRLRLDPSSP